MAGSSSPDLLLLTEKQGMPSTLRMGWREPPPKAELTLSLACRLYAAAQPTVRHAHQTRCARMAGCALWSRCASRGRIGPSRTMCRGAGPHCRGPYRYETQAAVAAPPVKPGGAGEWSQAFSCLLYILGELASAAGCGERGGSAFPPFVSHAAGPTCASKPRRALFQDARHERCQLSLSTGPVRQRLL